MKLSYSTRIENARLSHGEDRIAEIRLPGRHIFVVVDGAGGATGGGAATDAVCKAAFERCPHGKAADWRAWLVRVDREMSRSGSGLAAAAAIEVRDDGRITGTSVGDCEAWIFGGDAAPRSLTARQARKPILGGGAAKPAAFEAQLGRGTLLVATDGLWKCMDRARIAEAVLLVRPLDAACAALIGGARLKSGALQDDVAIVLAEMA
jgi:PPM family protein phosphatase